MQSNAINDMSEPCQASVQQAVEPCVATVGYFDGVHLGHRCLVRQVKEEAVRRGLRSVVISFRQHPARVLRPDQPVDELTTAAEKKRLLLEAGADEVCLFDFTAETARLSAREYMEQVLLARLNVRVLVIGYDHRFGHNRSEGFEDYRKIGSEIGMEVVQAHELQGLGHVSSSAIRRALAAGRVEDAAAMLGRPYTLQGTVVHGYHVGTELGFPTANLQPGDAAKQVPMNGVYAVETIIGTGQVVQGMLNIGTRPTLENGTDRSIEVHLFDFGGDIYGQSVEIHFIRFIRNEKKFGSLAELQEQLQHDERACRALFTDSF